MSFIKLFNHSAHVFDHFLQFHVFSPFRISRPNNPTGFRVHPPDPPQETQARPSPNQSVHKTKHATKISEIHFLRKNQHFSEQTTPKPENLEQKLQKRELQKLQLTRKTRENQTLSTLLQRPLHLENVHFRRRMRC